MSLQPYLEQSDSFIFEFDNVLYPEKDFILQVYYLFAHFIEYSEQLPANELLDYMKAEFEENGLNEVFIKTITKWNIPEKYSLNFQLLLSNAKLPLKLELYPAMLKNLKRIITSDKQVFLLVKGDPAAQLNKIKQTDWQEIANNLVVYFHEEVANNKLDLGLSTILSSHRLNPERTVFVTNNENDSEAAKIVGVKYLNVNKLLS